MRETRVCQNLFRILDRFAAGAAEPSNQSLCQDEVNRCSNIEWRDAHIQKSHNRRGRIVGMQRRKDQVPRLRCLDGNVCGFKIPNLSHHDDVWILPQKRAQCGGKVEVGFFVDIDLIDSWQVDLNRIFNAADVDFRRVQGVQRRVQRDGFAAPCGSRHENHAVWPMNRLFICLELVGLEPQRRQAEIGTAAVEHPDDHFLTKLGRQGADPEVDFVSLGKRQLDPTVLRNPSFGNIQMREDFDTRDDSGRK